MVSYYERMDLGVDSKHYMERNFHYYMGGVFWDEQDSMHSNIVVVDNEHVHNHGVGVVRNLVLFVNYNSMCGERLLLEQDLQVVQHS